MSDCIFCDFAEDNSQKFWENGFFYTRFDDFPVSSGHSLIIPKIHRVGLLDLTKEEWGGLRVALAETIKLIESSDMKMHYQERLRDPISDISRWYLQKALASEYLNEKPDAYNIGVNDGTAAGRTIDHLHLQVIPRYRGDVDDPRGGVRHVIPGMGNYKIPRK